MSIAEDMLDGLLCCGCGVYIGKNGEGPSYCSDCKPPTKSIKIEKTIKCPMCNKRFKKQWDLDQHRKDVHG